MNFSQCLPYVIAANLCLFSNSSLPPPASLWLGGTVSAANNGHDGIQLGCDPRFLYKPLPVNESSTNRAGGPTTGPRRPHHLGTGTCALYTGASIDYTSVDACSSQEEGACLAGFSADLVPGKRFGEVFVALGMPGSYLTEGNVFLGHYLGKRQVSGFRLKSSPTDLAHRGFNLGYSIALDRLDRLRLPESSEEGPKPNREQLMETDEPEARATGTNWRSRITPSADPQSGEAGRLTNEDVMRLKAKELAQTNSAFAGPLDDTYQSAFGGRPLSVITSSPMWVDNEYRGIVMILNQALDLGKVSWRLRFKTLANYQPKTFVFLYSSTLR
ncbi:unnamed protein product [Protopolystoma xenopodis]|uniref:Uncharacterized protein n=1 Tax=Protopolystoma xenopodis TaxID=117903 RepID=A0A3S5B0C5_9PLAT|nr:unnamed protein product [Protopolystoma xenopodis]